MKRNQRIIVYPKDVAIITGRSERYGRLVIQRIKDKLGKEKHQLVTVEEFADYVGLKKEIISSLIN